MPPPVTWTTDMIETLIKLRTVDKLRLSLCAEKIGVSENVCRRKAKELGLNEKIFKGRKKVIKDKDALEHRRRLQREWKAADRRRRPEYYRAQANAYNRRKQA
jgi:Zn-dependent peptidase ImmA (M78 family)